MRSSVPLPAKTQPIVILHGSALGAILFLGEAWDMLSGAHVIIYSTDAEADRGFFRDILGLTHVDAGDGWLIFSLPPSELAVHPASGNGVHELYLVCEDIEAFVAVMKTRDVACSDVQDRGWGRLTELTLPGGGRIGVYQPRHVRPVHAA